MAPRRVELKFKIDAYTPETLPLERLAQYLTELATLFGERQSVHFKRLESGSTIPVFDIEWEAAPKVRRRVNDARNGEGPEEAREAWRQIDQQLFDDNATGDLVDAETGARILHFPGRDRLTQQEFGPFNEPGTLDGTVIMIGGSGNKVPVHLQDGSRILVCQAIRPVARQLAEHLFEGRVRVSGIGRWLRNEHARWEMKKFTIQNFTLLDAATLPDLVARLRSIDGPWKQDGDTTIEQLLAMRVDDADAEER